MYIYYIKRLLDEYIQVKKFQNTFISKWPGRVVQSTQNHLLFHGLNYKCQTLNWQQKKEDRRIYRAQVTRTSVYLHLLFILRNIIMLFCWNIPLRPLNRLHQYWLHPTTKYPQKYNVSHFLSLPDLFYSDNLCDPDIRFCPKTQFILYMLQMYFIETSFMHFIERHVK